MLKVKKWIVYFLYDRKVEKELKLSSFRKGNVKMIFILILEL